MKKRLFLICLLFFTLANLSPALSAEKSAQKVLPPALSFDKDVSWLNVSRPLTIEELRGKIVILDFWTYGCINCIHVLEDLNRLHQKYGEKVAIIGVHTPKFDNEKNLETLRRIVIRYNIKHPVINDTHSNLARAYGMRAWPTQFVITPQGRVLGKITGEGNYEVFERVIDQLLDEQTDAKNNKALPISLEKDKLAASFLAFPGKITTSDLYVAISDTLHHRIILTDHSGNLQKIIGAGTAGFVDGELDNAQFLNPQGLVFSGDTLYVADTGNHSIRAIDLVSGRVNTVAGNGKITIEIKNDKPATQTSLRSPWDIVIWNKTPLIAMAGEHQIWSLNLEKNKIEPFSGNGREALVDGSLEDASYSQPSGLSLYKDTLYVADSESSAVRKIDLRNKTVRTLIGKGLFDFGDKDGDFSSALLQHNLGIAALNDNQIFVADTYNHKLKLLDLSTKEIMAISTKNAAGSDKNTDLNEPGGLAILGKIVLIADTNNHRIMQYNSESKVLSEWPIIRN